MPDHFKETPSVTAEFPAGNFTFVISYFVFCKKDIPTNFTKLTGKHLCQSLFFNTSWRLRAPALLKKRLWHICFPLNFKKILGLPFLHNTSKELLLKMGSFQNRCSTEYQADYMIKIFKKYQWRSSIFVKLRSSLPEVFL